MDPAELMKILLWEAGIIVVLLSCILGFVVAWQIRQDSKVNTMVETIGRMQERMNDLDFYMKHNIPELYAKWDKVVMSMPKSSSGPMKTPS